MLKMVAGTTGGRYYLATDTAALMSAYTEINALETTEIDLGDYYEFKEAFMPYLLLGALFTLASVMVRRSAFEVVP
jgi:Ca-activated chloride channel family protein